MAPMDALLVRQSQCQRLGMRSDGSKSFQRPGWGLPCLWQTDILTEIPLDGGPIGAMQAIGGWDARHS